MPVCKKPILTLAVLAAEAITEHTAVSYTGTTATAGGVAMGFATADAATGEMVAVDMLGTTIAISGAAIAQGAALQIGTGGKVITKTSGTLVARAMQAASAADQAIEVIMLSN